jgi:hypothetical protein
VVFPHLSDAERGDHEALALPALNPDFLYAALDANAYAAFVKESARSAPEPSSCTGNPGKRVIRVETLSFPHQ